VTGAFASDPREQSRAAYYADFIFYPLLIMGLGVIETGSVHKVPYLWLCLWLSDCSCGGLLSMEPIASFCVLLKRSPDFANNTMRCLVRMWNSDLDEPAVLWAGWVHSRGHSVRPGRGERSDDGTRARYIWYFVVHDAVHRPHLKYGSLLYRAKMHHALHRYANLRGNYGVSSPFWDYTFGTYIAPGPRRSKTAVGQGTLDAGTDTWRKKAG
jgi:fatty acid hydroxylase family protein